MLCMTKLDHIKHFLCAWLCSGWGLHEWWKGWVEVYEELPSFSEVGGTILTSTTPPLK